MIRISGDDRSVIGGFMMPLSSPLMLPGWLVASEYPVLCVGRVQHEKLSDFVFREPPSRVRVGFAQKRHRI